MSVKPSSTLGFRALLATDDPFAHHRAATLALFALGLRETLLAGTVRHETPLNLQGLTESNHALGAEHTPPLGGVDAERILENHPGRLVPPYRQTSQDARKGPYSWKPFEP